MVRSAAVECGGGGGARGGGGRSVKSKTALQCAVEQEVCYIKATHGREGVGRPAQIPAASNPEIALRLLTCQSTRL